MTADAATRRRPISRSCLPLALGCYASAIEKFKMTVPVAPQLYFDDGSGFFDLLTAEIFRRLEIEYEMIQLPPQRSLVYTNSANYDGHIARTSAIEARFPDLVRVPVDVFDFESMVYAKTPDLRSPAGLACCPIRSG